MKWFATAMIVLLVGIGALVADRSTNRGLTVGYYGELNKLTAAMESLPGVSIDSSSYNRDASLEEIWFRITDAQGRSRSIDFGQNDPIRELSGTRLEAALAMRLAE
jgi:hypothetical protein